MIYKVNNRLRLVSVSDIDDKYNDIYRAIDMNLQMVNEEIFKSEFVEGIFLEVTVKICIPSGGVYHNLDVRKNENILIYLSPEYPFIAPAVIISRDDFPFFRTPHLNLGIHNTNINELNLCLYRGDINEWFLSNGEQAFCDLINEWFSDLVNGELIKDDGFESIRIMNSIAIIEADFQRISLEIEKDNKRNYRFLEMDTHNRPGYFKVSNCEYCEKKNTSPCILIYDNKIVDDLYLSATLSCSNDLKAFSSYNKLSHAVQRFRSKYYNPSTNSALDGIWILMAIKRPQQVIGTFSNFEYLAFWLDFNFAQNPVIDNCKISMASTIQALNKNIAEKLSGTKKTEKNIAIIGCGAVGSKIAMLLAKMGYVNQKLIDNDIMLPHNFVRHEINNPNCLGFYKAEVLNFEIKGLFQEAKIETNTKESFENQIDYKDCIVVDCTASERNLYWYITSKINCERFLRCEIFMDGKLGVTFIEGENHNPDVYDTRISFFAIAMNDSILKEIFLDNNNINKEFHIGFGCSSDTMVIDDATISNHTSIVPHIIDNYNDLLDGVIYINYMDKSCLINNFLNKLVISPFEKFDSESGWEIHIKKDIFDKAQYYVKQSIENMGLWFGCINENMKRITVVDTYVPADNIRTETMVKGGSSGVKKIISDFDKLSRGVICYIGEWHTHPIGSATPSNIDKRTFSEVKKIKKLFLMTIFAKNEIGNWVLDSEETNGKS